MIDESNSSDSRSMLDIRCAGINEPDSDILNYFLSPFIL